MKSHLQIKGFTLLELLAVIAIIGTLSAVGIPMYQDYKIGVIEKQSVNNLQSIALSQSEYVRDQNTYFSGNTEAIDKEFFGGKGKLSQGKYQYESNGDEKSYIASSCIKNSNSRALSFNINQDKVINLNTSCGSKSSEVKAGSEKAEVEKKESSVFSDCTCPYCAWDEPDACIAYVRDLDGKGMTVINLGGHGKFRAWSVYEELELVMKDMPGPLVLDVDYYLTPKSKMLKYPEPSRFPDKYLRDKGM
jgi:prepilin-type N-terminal cleavage/methylation domain-containing protein